MNHDYYFEAVEVCPHCMSENTYPMWDTKVSGFVAVCKYCGKEIFLCDECLHTVEEDGEPHDCDWCETKCGGKCHRGITRDKEMGKTDNTKEYTYKVCLCDGHYCNGSITMRAETEEEAEEAVMDYVLIKLANALPELGIDVFIELID